jgi:uncharacterized membrane protein YdjX (TVP38/TMEM64 family)
MALTPMRLRTFVAVSWLGMVPVSLMYAYAGQGLGQMERPSDALSLEVLGPLMLLAAVPLVVRLVIGRWRLLSKPEEAQAREP